MTRRLALPLLAVSLLASPAMRASQSDTKSLPYVAVHNPEFIAASQAGFMKGDDRLIGIAEGRTVKAYPAGLLAQHGLVEDDSPSGPIAVTW